MGNLIRGLIKNHRVRFLACNTKDIILLLHILGREKSRDILECLIP